MSLSILQEFNAVGSPFLPSGTAEQVLATPCGIGTCVVLSIAVNTPTIGSVTSVTSSMGTFTRVNDLAGNAFIGEQEWWICLKTTASASTVTVTTSGGVGWIATAFEWAGGVASASSGGSLAAGSFSSGQSISLTVSCAAGDAVLVAGSNGNTGSSSVLVSQPPSPWSVFPTPPSGGTVSPLVAQQVVTATSVTATWVVQGVGNTAIASLLGLILVPDSPASPAPTLVSPANAGFDNVSSGQAFSATYNASGADNMGAYAMRLKVSGGSYSYWNAGTNALQSSIVWNTDVVAPNASFGPTLPNTAVANGNIYNWSLACSDNVSGGQGPFAVDYTFTAQAPPTVSVTAPTGTVSTTTQPTVQWTPTTAPGTIQVAYGIIVESGTYGSAPGSGTQVWSSGLVTSGLNNAQIGVPLVNGTSYRAFVQIEQTGGQTSAWGFSTFTITADVPATPTITATQTTDGATGCPIIKLQVQGFDNYLSAVDSSFETGVGTWTATTNCSVAQSAAQALDGTHCLAMTPSAAGNIVATSGTYAASPGQLVQVFAAFRAAISARTCTVTLQWVGAAGSVASSGTADSTSAWTQASSTSAPAAGLIASGTAPAGTTGYKIVLTVASTSGATDIHYVDCVAAKPTAGSPTWSIGGFVGLTTVVITRSDNNYVRWASAANPLPVPSSGQLATVNDYEAIPGVSYTYSAIVQVASVPIASVPATSAAAQVPVATYGWWELNPLAGTATTNPSAVNAQMVQWTSEQTEQATANQVLNQMTMGVVSNGVMAQDFSGTAETFSDAIYTAFNALLTSGQTVYISSPWGLIDSGYFRIGPQSGGMSSGMGTKTKSTTLMPSIAGSGHRSVALTAIAQPRPPV